jgi:hypothetical protein
VSAPDDMTISRGIEKPSARDNVVLEAGIFIGALGYERTFILVQRSASNEIFIPSDFAGFVRADFSPAADSGAHKDLNAALESIIARIEDLGPGVRSPHNEMLALRERLTEISVEVSGKSRSIESIINGAAQKHPRPWSVLSKPALLMDPIANKFSRGVTDDVYWWLVVEGVLKFKNTDDFISGTTWYWRHSIPCVELSSRGAALLNLLRSERPIPRGDTPHTG